jgi:hypothetical protein
MFLFGYNTNDKVFTFRFHALSLLDEFDDCPDCVTFPSVPAASAPVLPASGAEGGRLRLPATKKFMPSPLRNLVKKYELNHNKKCFGFF